MRCAVYSYVGNYGGGLVFVPLEHEQYWLKLTMGMRQIANYKRLGEMNVDEKVIEFTVTQVHEDWGVPPFPEADYTYYE